MLRPVDHFLAEGECIMNKEIPPRRVVMRAALAAGCSLWMPIALSADDPKKREQFPGSASSDQKNAPGKRAISDEAKGRSEMFRLPEFHRRDEYLQGG
jgi:hypothetical protein